MSYNHFSNTLWSNYITKLNHMAQTIAPIIWCYCSKLSLTHSYRLGSRDILVWVPNPENEKQDFSEKFVNHNVIY